MMTSIKVAVRVRPLSNRESDGKSKVVVDIRGKDVLVTDVKVPEKCDYDHRVRLHKFTFDYGFSSVEPIGSKKCASQQIVYEEFGRVVLDTLLDGYNSCVIAYGPSGSGKTYTLIGTHTQDEMGLAPRICEGLFTKPMDCTRQQLPFQIVISFMELCNEQVYDLLNVSDVQNNRKTKLRIREHPVYGPFVEGLSTHAVENVNQVCELLARGNGARVHDIQTNDRSNRSHAIFTVHCSQVPIDEQKSKEVVSKLHLVDLAGSEKAVPEYCQSRIQEGGNINKSLVTLGNVISILVELAKKRQIQYKHTYVPYRDSNLTWLLKDSLGGNSHTFMLAAISPSKECYIETISTLRYAQRVKLVFNSPVINEELSNDSISKLQEDVAKLRCLISSAEQLSKAYVMKSTPEVVYLKSYMKESAKRVDLLAKHWLEKWLQADTRIKLEKMKNENLHENTKRRIQSNFSGNNYGNSAGSSNGKSLSENSVFYCKKKYTADSTTVYDGNSNSIKLCHNDSYNKIFNKLRQYYSSSGNKSSSVPKSISENRIQCAEPIHKLSSPRSLSLSTKNFRQTQGSYFFEAENQNEKVELYKNTTQVSKKNEFGNELNVEIHKIDGNSLIIISDNKSECNDLRKFAQDVTLNYVLEPKEPFESVIANANTEDRVKQVNVCFRGTGNEDKNNESNDSFHVASTTCNKQSDSQNNYVDKSLITLNASDRSAEIAISNHPHRQFTQKSFKNEFSVDIVENSDMFNERVYEGSKQVLEFLKLLRPESVDSSSGCYSPRRKDSEMMSRLSFSSLDGQCLKSLDDISSNEETDSSCRKPVGLQFNIESSNCQRMQANPNQNTTRLLQLTECQCLPIVEKTANDVKTYEQDNKSYESTTLPRHKQISHDRPSFSSSLSLRRKNGIEKCTHSGNGAIVETLSYTPQQYQTTIANDDHIRKVLHVEQNLLQCNSTIQRQIGNITSPWEPIHGYENFQETTNQNRSIDFKYKQTSNLKLTKTNLDLLDSEIKELSNMFSNYSDSYVCTRDHSPIYNKEYNASNLKTLDIIDPGNVPEIDKKTDKYKMAVAEASQNTEKFSFEKICHLPNTVFSDLSNVLITTQTNDDSNLSSPFASESECHNKLSSPIFTVFKKADSIQETPKITESNATEINFPDPRRFDNYNVNSEYFQLNPDIRIKHKTQDIEETEKESESDFNDSLTLDSLDNFDQEMKAWANKYLTKYDFQKNSPVSGCERIIQPEIITQGDNPHDLVEIEFTSKNTFPNFEANKLFSSISNSTSSDSITYVFVGKDEDTMQNNIPYTNSQYSSLLNSLSLDSLEKNALNSKFQGFHSPRTLSIDSLVAEEMLHQLQHGDTRQMKKRETLDSIDAHVISEVNKHCQISIPGVSCIPNADQNYFEVNTEDLSKGRYPITVPRSCLNKKKASSEIPTNILDNRESNPSFPICEQFHESYINSLNFEFINHEEPLFVVNPTHAKETALENNDHSTIFSHVPCIEPQMVIPPPSLFTSEQIFFEPKKENTIDAEFQDYIENPSQFTQTENVPLSSSSLTKLHLESVATNGILQLTLRMINFMEKTLNYIKNKKHSCECHFRSKRRCTSKQTRRKLIASTSDDPISIQENCRLTNDNFNNEFLKNVSGQEQNKFKYFKNKSKKNARKNLAKMSTENNTAIHFPKYLTQDQEVFHNVEMDESALSQPKQLSSFLQNSKIEFKNSIWSSGKHILDELQSKISDASTRNEVLHRISKDSSRDKKLKQCNEISPKKHLEHLLNIRRRVIEDTNSLNTTAPNESLQMTRQTRNYNGANPVADFESSSEGYLSSITSLTTSLSSETNAHIRIQEQQIQHSTPKSRKTLILDVHGKPQVGTSRSLQNTSADSGAFFLDSPHIENQISAVTEVQRRGRHEILSSLDQEIQNYMEQHLLPKTILRDSVAPDLETFNRPTPSSYLSNNEMPLDIFATNSIDKFECYDASLKKNTDLLLDHKKGRVETSESGWTSWKDDLGRKDARAELVMKLSDSTYKLTRQDIESVLVSIQVDKMLLRKKRNLILDQTFFPNFSLSSPLSSSESLCSWDSYKRLPNSVLYFNFPSSNVPA